MTEARNLVNWEITQRILRDLIDSHSRAGRAGQIIVVGGSAMMAHQMRISSGDIDVYSPVIDQDIVQDIEERYQAELGNDFRIDATGTENIWGNILIRDIEKDSPVIGHVDTASGRWTLRTMSIETLFLVKMEAGRAKDHEDLAHIARRTSMEKVANRFVQLAPWHGIPDALTGFADRFIEKAQHLWGSAPAQTLSRIAPGLPKRALGMLRDAWSEDLSTQSPPADKAPEQASASQSGKDCRRPRR
jgi:hypothetical protein